MTKITQKFQNDKKPAFLNNLTQQPIAQQAQHPFSKPPFTLYSPLILIMSSIINCPYADSRHFSTNDETLRTAITKKEVLRAKENIAAITSASSLRYYATTKTAFIGKPDRSAEGRAYSAMLEAWRALDEAIWSMAGPQDWMREAYDD